MPFSFYTCLFSATTVPASRATIMTTCPRISHQAGLLVFVGVASVILPKRLRTHARTSAILRRYHSWSSCNSSKVFVLDSHADLSCIDDIEQQAQLRFRTKVAGAQIILGIHHKTIRAPYKRTVLCACHQLENSLRCRLREWHAWQLAPRSLEVFA